MPDGEEPYIGKRSNRTVLGDISNNTPSKIKKKSPIVSSERNDENSLKVTERKLIHTTTEKAISDSPFNPRSELVIKTSPNLNDSSEVNSTCSDINPVQNQFLPVHLTPLDSSSTRHLDTPNFLSMSASYRRIEILDVFDPYNRLEFSPVKKLGSGSCNICSHESDGDVWKVVHNATNQTFARKTMSTSNQGIPQSALREISVLKELKHPCCVRLLHVEAEKNCIHLFFQYYPYDLHQFLYGGDFSPSQPIALIKSYTYQLLSSISYLHQKRILHRDIKPGNVLIDETGTIKLCDFGLSRTVNVPVDLMTSEVETLWYRAPEILLAEKDILKYSTGCDTWSCGCLLAELVSGKALFQGKNQISQLREIFSSIPCNSQQLSELQTFLKINTDEKESEELLSTFRNCYSPEKSLKSRFRQTGLFPYGIDLLERLLDMNPRNRISAKAALTHPFFYDLPGDVYKVTSLSSSEEFEKYQMSNEWKLRTAERRKIRQARVEERERGEEAILSLSQVEISHWMESNNP